MIFDRTPVRFRKDLLYKSQFYVVNITMSGSILINNLHYISFFEGWSLRYSYSKELRFVTVDKDIRSNGDVEPIRH